MSEQEKLFRAQGHPIKHEFEIDGKKYLLYKHGEFPEVFITGDFFNWKFGIIWSKYHHCPVESYFVTQDVVRSVERFLS